MSVRFIIGRAASGKTQRCLEAIRARLRESPVDGPKLLLLVPEQASFQMERALIETPDLPGYTRCEVLSFQRLARRIFAESGGPSGAEQTIGPLGRMMALRRLIARERPSLRLLQRVADKPGLVTQLAAAIEELMREDVCPEAVAQLASGLQDRPLQQAKLADLARLYQAYLDYLTEERTDPAAYLGLAAERLPNCSSLACADIWVDGFAGFTGQESRLLVALAQCARNMEITLLLDPGASVITSDNLPKETYSLFARTERTLVRLRQMLKSAAVPIDAPVLLNESHFAAPSLGALEAGLLREAASTANNATETAPAVTIHEFPDLRTEVHRAVGEILRLTREGLRYRDIAVIVRDLSAYHDLLAPALRAHNIPCFIDQRQPTSHHPLIELVRGLLALADDDCRFDSVRLTLKTGLLPLRPDEADLLENYMLASGIQGYALLRQPWRYRRFFRAGAEDELDERDLQVLERVNRLRVRWLAAVEPWMKAVAERAQRSGRELAAALADCLNGLHVGGQLQDWAAAAEQDGRTDEADAHGQVWVDFRELLDEFVRALGDEPLGVREFREVIEAGLAEFRLGLAPPTIDQVLVGAIERSRHPSIRAALVLGFDDAHFPLRRSEDPLLGDEEREALEAAGVPVGPSRVRQLLDERMLAYIALSRAGQHLWISYPRSDAGSGPLNPSPYLYDVLAAAPGLRVTRHADPRRQRPPAALTRPAELAARLAAEFRSRPVLGQDSDPPARAAWNGLYAAARERDDWRSTLSGCLAGLRYTNEAVLAKGIPPRAFTSPFPASVSRLERFAACPYAHFIEYTLKLQPRPDAELADVDLGTLSHAVLEKFVDGLARRGLSLAELPEDEAREQLDAIGQQLAASFCKEVLQDTPRTRFLLDRGRMNLQRVMRWQRQSAGAGTSKPCKVELRFGEGGVPPLQLATPGGRTVLLRGRIDRVDVAELGGELAGIIIDYKRTTERRLDLAEVYYGLALQLVGYMLALQATGKSLTGRDIQPVAALYLPLLEPYETVDHPADEKSRTYRWRGVVDVAGARVLDAKLASRGASQFFSARLTRDGRPDTRCDLAGSAELRALMAHVRNTMGQLADRILDGEISIRPYRFRKFMPCSYCQYRAVCRYEIECQPPRRLENMARKDVLAAITGGEHA